MIQQMILLKAANDFPTLQKEISSSVENICLSSIWSVAKFQKNSSSLRISPSLSKNKFYLLTSLNPLSDFSFLSVEAKSFFLENVELFLFFFSFFVFIFIFIC